MPSRILFIGRQPGQFSVLWKRLSFEDMEVVFAASQQRALRELARAATQVIVLDACSLPLAVESTSRTLRQQAPTARLILIVEGDAAAALSYDYLLTAPVSWRHLLQAIEEALRSEERQVVSAGFFVIDMRERVVTGPAGEARLTPKQYRLLVLLMRHAGKIVPRQKIMAEVWETDFLGDTRTLDVHVSWLRRVIEPNPKKPVYLRTERGVGYIFHPDGQAPPAPSTDEEEPQGPAGD